MEAAGLIGTATTKKNGLISSFLYNNAIPQGLNWVGGAYLAGTVTLVASIAQYDIVKLQVLAGAADYGFYATANICSELYINNRGSINGSWIKQNSLLNEGIFYLEMEGTNLNVYYKASTSAYNYLNAKCEFSVLGIGHQSIIKMVRVDKDVSTLESFS